MTENRGANIHVKKKKKIHFAWLEKCHEMNVKLVEKLDSDSKGKKK